MISKHIHSTCGYPFVVEWSEPDDPIQRQLGFEYCDIVCVHCQVAARHTMMRDYWQGRTSREKAMREVEARGVDEINYQSKANPQLLQHIMAFIDHQLAILARHLDEEYYAPVRDLWALEIAPPGGAVDDWKYRDPIAKVCRVCCRPKGHHRDWCSVGAMEDFQSAFQKFPTPSWETYHQWFSRMRHHPVAHTPPTIGSEL